MFKHETMISKGWLKKLMSDCRLSHFPTKICFLSDSSPKYICMYEVNLQIRALQRSGLHLKVEKQKVRGGGDGGWGG